MSHPAIRRYAIGAYYPNGTLKTKKRYTRKRNYNLTYRGRISQKALKKLRKENLVVLVAMFMAITIGVISHFAASTNSIYINGDAVEASTFADTATLVEPQSVEADFTPPSTVEAVRVETVEERIRRVAAEQNFRWSDYLIKLACCEGLMSPETENTKGNYPVGSIDRGLYGINNYWHAEVNDECAKDIQCSTEWVIQKINAGYQTEWKCDKRIKKANYIMDERC